MNYLLNASLLFLALGIFSSVTLLGASQALLIVPGFYYLWKAYRSDQLKLEKSTWLLIAFIVVAFISLILNLDVVHNPKKNFGQLRYPLLMGVVCLSAYVVWIREASEKIKKILGYSFLVIICLTGLVCLYQKVFLHQERAKSLTDTLRYGYGTAMILPVLISCFLKPRLFPFLNRKILFLSILLGFGGLYVSYTRGAMLGLICAIPFVLLFWNKRIGVISLISSTFIVGFLGWFYIFGTGEIGNRYISSRHNSSDDVRMTQWESAYKGWLESPLLGRGYSNFINESQALKIKYGIKHSDYRGHAHNIYLELLFGTGIIGLVLFLSWIFCWCYEVIKGDKEIAALVIPFCISFLVSGIVEVTFDANNAAMIFSFYALTVAYISSKKNSQSFL